MRFADEFHERVLAAMSALYIHSAEHQDTLEEIRRVCQDPANQWRLAVFDIDQGLRVLTETAAGYAWVAGRFVETGTRDDAGVPGWTFQEGLYPQVDLAIKGLPGLNYGQRMASNPDEPPPAILVIKNGHLLWKTPGVIQMVANQVEYGKAHRQHIVILSPVVDIPPELAKLFESGLIRYPLPDRRQLREIAEGIAGGGDLPAEESEEWLRIADAAAGLTRMQAEDAFALSLVRHDRFEADEIFRIKAQALENFGALKLYQPHEEVVGGKPQLRESFANLGGLDYLKTFTLECLAKREENPLRRPRGVFLVGPPGVGKSAFCKALGFETGRPTLVANLGATRSKYQGETERLTRELTERADAMAPCNLFLDEFEKLVAGGKSSGQTDSGVKAGQIAHLLSWMQDHTSDVYLVVTCNDIRQLLADNPEIVRLGRFDAMFYLDFPGRKAKDAIWRIHLQRYGLLEEGQELESIELPDDEQWTGAEIETCCRLALLRGRTVAEIGKTIVRIADQAGDAIAAARAWAEGRCLAAEYDDIFRREQHARRLQAVYGSDNGRRQVVRKRKAPRIGEG